jgi:hypothetical protein
MRIYSIFRRRWQTWCLRARPLKNLRLVGYDRSVVTIPIYSDTCKFTRACTLLPHIKQLKVPAILAENGEPNVS